ncbi:MAG: hypothetical protein FWC87_13880, partial [Acidimicrobiaceae bacterium]|nr:hypothetical protein [Acidimicrobiaceae bacterium]
MHTDVPDRERVGRLLAYRGPCCVSIYLPTDPASPGEAERIEFKNLAAEGVQQMRDANFPVRQINPIEEAMADLLDDEVFWRYLGRSLAVFV